MDNKKSNMLMYRGKPLLRKDNTLYYGFTDDSHIIMMQILETREENGLKMATKVRVELQSNDPNLRYRERIQKKTEKDGLYNAMDVAAVWLERALTK